MLFLIQWLGGVYCAKKGGMDDDWVWIACIFVGWLFIIMYFIDNAGSNHTTANTKSYTSSPTTPPASTVSPKVPVSPQSYSIPVEQPSPSKSTLPIEEQILNYLKKQPVEWEYPLRNQDESLNKFCSTLVFSETVTAVGSDENIRALESTIQQKRARNPQLDDYNATMEGNILSLVYKCSYLMHIFPAMDAIKFDVTKVDMQKLWLLIQEDCNARIGNLEEEKRKNPAIQATISKYDHDYQTMNLRVLNAATGREMDYIIYTIMSSFLVVVISLLFRNPQLLQTLKQYPTDDVMGMVNNHVLTAAALRFNAYSRNFK